MTMRSLIPHKRDRGFTLIEAAIVIIVTAIVMAGVAIFIRIPVRGYVDSAARADLADTADTALRRMARDLRLALPNSVRVNTDGSGAYYIEELLTRTGGRYLSQDDGATSGNYLDFFNASPNPLKFDIVGPIPTGEQTIQAGSDSVVVYNLGSGVPAGTPGDAYETTAGAMNRALISSINGPTITMASNPFDAQISPKATSTQHRFQVISGPVTYRCDPNTGTVTRYWNYTISYSQPLSIAALTTGATAQSALVATGISGNNGCSFTYSNANSMSSALAILRIKLASTDSGSSTVELFQQVHIDNTP
jgi:MSHA biogenesis protein MshO